MDKYRKIHQQTIERPSFMRTNEFIQAKLFRSDLTSLTFEMGPNCKQRCFHCGSNCGPERRGLPTPDVAIATLAGAIHTNVSKVSLTNGEPLREENKSTLEEIGKFANLFPTYVISNGIFAQTRESAVEWLTYLKKVGFDYPRNRGCLNVSFGEMYPTTTEHWRNILTSVQEVFPRQDPGRIVLFRHVGFFREEDRLRVNSLLEVIKETLGKRRSERIDAQRDPGSINIWAYPLKGTPIKVDFNPCGPWGRAADNPLFNESYPVRTLAPKDLSIPFDDARTFAVFYNGDVCFSDCTSDIERNLPYGNTTREPLSVILSKIRSDVFFQAYKLGGDALLYYAAQKKDPRFIVEGRSKWHVRKAIFGNRKLIDKIRDYFSKEGVVDSYKEFMDSVDMGDRGLV